MDRKELGNKVRYVRERKHLTQQNMADALGMSSAKQYGRYETGESKLDMEFLERIAVVLELTLVELLAYDESMSFNYCKQANAFSTKSSFHEASDKEREQYEARVKDLEEAVAFAGDEQVAPGAVGGEVVVEAAGSVLV
ncbi:MAG: helix-turn-helix transcriptional regulator [Flavobacteriales bacterium]